MVARIRRSRHGIVLAAALAIVTVAFVVVDSLPAQAQVYYSYPYSPYPPFSLYVGPWCQTLYIGPLGFTTCNNPWPYGYGPSYGPYYYGYPVPRYYRGGPWRNERHGGHEHE